MSTAGIELIWKQRSARMRSDQGSGPASSPDTPVVPAGRRLAQIQAGFSLLELVMVLMLLALATAFVIPSLGRGLATAQLRASSREIAAAVRLARSRAVREQEVYLLGFDLNKNEVELASLNSSYRRSFELPNGIHLTKVSLVERTSEDEDENPAFYFLPNGRSQGFQVFLRNEQGKVLKVTHNNLKGPSIVDEDDPSIAANASN
jgi:general secretion pathway protein H